MNLYIRRLLNTGGFDFWKFGNVTDIVGLFVFTGCALLVNVFTLSENTSFIDTFVCRIFFFLSRDVFAHKTSENTFLYYCFFGGSYFKLIL